MPGLPPATSQVVNGIGVEYYPTGQGPAPSPSTMEGALLNLGVEGLPISITEYGQQSDHNRADTQHGSG